MTVAAKQIAIVTGGANGIGRTLALQLVDLNWRVYIVDRDNSAINSMRTLPECRSDNIAFISCDLQDPQAAAEISAAISDIPEDTQRFSLFSVAGRALPDEFEAELDLSVDVFRKSVEANLVTHYTAVRSVLPKLKAIEGKKSIVAVSSINAIMSAHLPGYSSAKSGIRGLVSSLARPLRIEASTSINAALIGSVIPTSELRAEPKDMQALDNSTFRGTCLTESEVGDFLIWLSQAPLEFSGRELIFDAGQTLNLVGYRR